MHWTDPAFTEQATPVTLALDKTFVKNRSAFFAPELVGEGGYTNYLDTECRIANKEIIHSRFGNNFPRLVGAKRKYDPGNLFGRWFAIPREL